MAAEDERRKLIRERDYLADRLAEISKDLNRLSVESTTLKEEMEDAAVPAADRLKAIRRRRFYLGRYTEDLKAERQRMTADHQKLAARVATRDPKKEK